jgi:hypothetical protein
MTFGYIAARAMAAGTRRNPRRLPTRVDIRDLLFPASSHDAGHGQNAFPGTPAQGSGMVASWGSGSITVRVCFG